MAEKDEAPKIREGPGPFRTCRTCNMRFDVTLNSDSSCRYHPESFCGETAQRWLAPGDTEGGGVVHEFYSCCGGKAVDTPGCCFTTHKTYDEAEVAWGRRPGMGSNTERESVSEKEKVKVKVGSTSTSLSLFVLAIMCVLAAGSLGTAAAEAGGTEQQHLFVYDWPDLQDRYANFTDRKDAHGVEIPHWRLHHGLGRVVDGANMEHKTSQFALHKIFYERALLDPRRTLDPAKATSFFIPFDLGMHTAFLESNGRMRRSNCPSAPLVIKRLNESAWFRRKMGHDHTLVFALNQNMNYFMAGPRCQEFLRFCWNCTKLSIDEYLFTAKDRNFEMKNRGINWHAVPFPSDYHYSSRQLAEETQPLPNPSTSNSVATAFVSSASATSSSSSSSSSSVSVSSWLPPWERTTARPTIVSFTGSPRRYNDIATAMREALIKQCAAHGTSCVYGKYSHDPKALSNPGKLARESVFCLQPPGDMPTRKSVFDAVLSGCIPVLFHPLTARLMYEWHLGQTLWEEIAVNFDSHAENRLLVDNQADFVAKLISLYRDEPTAVARKQSRLREVAHQLQYSLISDEPTESPGSKLKPHVHVQSRDGRVLPDAYETAMRRVLDIHSGRASHRRVAHYVVCDQLAGRGQILQTADWCNSTSSLEDPSSPPSVVDFK